MPTPPCEVPDIENESIVKQVSQAAEKENISLNSNTCGKHEQRQDAEKKTDVKPESSEPFRYRLVKKKPERRQNNLNSSYYSDAGI